MAFTDFIQIQRDIAHCYLSDDWLAPVNVMTREEIIDGQSKLEDATLAAETLVYIATRNGKRGAGIIVEKPEFHAVDPNVPGPQGNLVITSLILEDWTENLAAANGTLKPSDQIAQRCLDLLHHWALQGLGVVIADGNAIAPAQDWEPLRAYRVRVRILQNRGQTQRVQPVTFTGVASPQVLSCATAGATIYYTTDGISTPAPSNVAPKGNGAALVYPGVPGIILPIATTTTIRAAAFKAGMIQSPINQKTIVT